MLQRWTRQEDDRLLALAESRLRWDQIGERLGRTGRACKSRYKDVCARRGVQRAYRDDIPRAGVDLVPRPERRPSCCPLHLRLVHQASGGRGFPFLIVPAAYRVAA
jgi:hypothetical protein